MRTIPGNKVIAAVEKLCGAANVEMPKDILEALEAAQKSEESPAARYALTQNIENARLALKSKMPLCQDTGMAVFFVEVGRDARIKEDIYKLIAEGVRRGYKKSYLRASMVGDPIFRKNTGDNTPPIIHTEIVSGSKLKIHFMPKGGGAENMSRQMTLTPSAGIEGVKKFIIETIENAGPNACPPFVVGVGIGGNFETAPLLAKKVLLRKIGTKHKDSFYKNLEQDLLEEANRLGIGAQGVGGSITALSVFVEVSPCHISAIPVAVNIQCHVCRHKSVTL